MEYGNKNEIIVKKGRKAKKKVCVLKMDHRVECWQEKENEKRKQQFRKRMLINWIHSRKLITRKNFVSMKNSTFRGEQSRCANKVCVCVCACMYVCVCVCVCVCMCDVSKWISVETMLWRNWRGQSQNFALVKNIYKENLGSFLLRKIECCRWCSSLKVLTVLSSGI